MDYEEILDKLGNELSRELDYPDMFRKARHFNCDMSNDGFLPLADEGCFMDAYIHMEDDMMAMFEKLAEPALYSRLEMERDWNRCYAVASFEPSDETELPSEIAEMSFRLKDSLHGFWEVIPTLEEQKEIIALAAKLQSAIESADELVGEELENWLDESALEARIRIGYTVDRNREDPFYMFVSVNFDSPYFRSNAENRQNGGREMDMLVAFEKTAIPENENEFRDIALSAMQKAFPGFSISEEEDRGPQR